MTLLFKHLPRGNIVGSGDIVFRHMGNEIPADPSTYIEFRSPESFTLATDASGRRWDGTLYYSLDAIIWKKWLGTLIESRLGVYGYSIYIRGLGNTRICSLVTGSWNAWLLSGSNISCFGNILNLLDYEKIAAQEEISLSEYCYYYLFYDCTALVSGPTLPATTLADSCYADMFDSCTSLTTAPALPARYLEDYCYNYMFENCSALKVYSSPGSGYDAVWRIPTSDDVSISKSFTKMFYGTIGSYTTTDSIRIASQITLYIQNPPV